MNGAVSYTYDSVGNRLQKTSTLPGFPGGSSTYNANDELTADQYDADGNTTGSGLNTGTSGYVYDFENRLVGQGGISIVYDGDGNRVSKATANGTTKYLVDELNPTGYAQVLDEVQNSAVVRTYSWGLELISEALPAGSPLATGHSPLSYYVFDGHGSVRALTDAAGAITDTYDYDAFGILTHSATTLSSPTPNNYLFAGEQFDPDLNLYYNRARYLNGASGRFWSRDDDAYEDDETPTSLNSYLYTYANPINNTDAGGHEIDEVDGLNASNTLDNMAVPNFKLVMDTALRIASTLSSLGLKFIAVEEGVKVKNGLAILYNDLAKNCTIGYGHLVHLGPCDSTEEADFVQGISLQRASDLLGTDSLDKVAALWRNTTVPLKQQELDALTSFIFNEGETNYKISDLRKTLNQGLYSLVPPLFLHFTRAGTAPNALLGRRKDESMLFQTGVYRARGKIIN